MMGGARATLPQAAPGEPHWIVVSLGHDGTPVEVKHSSVKHGQNWRRLFRHPSEELATTECTRLATLNPGKRFQVYASRFSCKVEQAEAPA